MLGQPRPISVLGTVVYVAAYSTATIAAQLSQAHREFCPIYAFITMAAMLHLYAEFVSDKKHGPPTERSADHDVGNG